MAEAVATSAPSAAPAAPAPEAQAQETQGSESVNSFKGTKHKVKVDGKVVEVDYDTLVNDYQVKSAADRRMEQAAKEKQQVSELMQGLQRGDKEAWGWLKKNVPKDVYLQIAEQDVWEKYQYDQLPEHERRSREVDERARQLEERERQLEDKGKQEQWAQEVDQAGVYIKSTIDEFFQSSGVQPTTAALIRITDYMQGHIGKTGKIPPMDKLYAHVARTLDLDAMDTIRSKPIEKLLEFLPKETVAALKKHLIQEAQSRQPSRYREEAVATARPKGQKALGIDAAFSALDKKWKSQRKS
jgi:hypothetical protein